VRKEEKLKDGAVEVWEAGGGRKARRQRGWSGIVAGLEEYWRLPVGVLASRKRMLNEGRGVRIWNRALELLAQSSGGKRRESVERAGGDEGGWCTAEIGFRDRERQRERRGGV
jgi:hypothetical protein